ncbi:GNAT family protein [Clostridiaceae bacterium 35-E11]
MRKVILESEDLLFCPTEIQDLNQVIIIERDKANQGFVYQWSEAQHREAIEAEDWMHMVIIKKISQAIIGYILLDEIKSEHQTIELTRIAIKEKGKGYGRQAIKLIKKLCFERLDCHRLWLDVFDENKKAIYLYETEGFIYEGTLRECKKYGDTYYSMRIMSMLEDEYRRQR